MKKSNVESNSGTSDQSSPAPFWDAGPFHWELGERALLMAILNVTPDSFSDGGLHLRLEDTLESATRFVSEGAEILDVGGESTRPGAVEVSLSEELSRVIPVVESLSRLKSAAISIDTCKPDVAREALRAGAHIVNDISGFRDPEMIEVCAASDCGLVVMHMQGSPQTMQNSPGYRDVVSELKTFFEERLATLMAAGIAPARIAFDPGIGFGKTLDHNLALLGGIEDYRVQSRPVLMGLSRKSFLGGLLGQNGMNLREVPTQALTCMTRQCGANIHRVHQVRECREGLRMMEAVMQTNHELING